jgi:hypothetical protein
MANYDGPAVIVQGAARVVIDCSISVTLGRWEGRFWNAAPPLSRNLSDAKKIELSDRRVGDISLASVEADHRSGRFRGSGPPPSNKSMKRHATRRA